MTQESIFSESRAAKAMEHLFWCVIACGWPVTFSSFSIFGMFGRSGFRAKLYLLSIIKSKVRSWRHFSSMFFDFVLEDNDEYVEQ